MKAASGVKPEPWWPFCLPVNEPDDELALHNLTGWRLILPVHLLSRRCEML